MRPVRFQHLLHSHLNFKYSEYVLLYVTLNFVQGLSLVGVTFWEQ